MLPLFISFMSGMWLSLPKMHMNSRSEYFLCYRKHLEDLIVPKQYPKQKIPSEKYQSTSYTKVVLRLQPHTVAAYLYCPCVPSLFNESRLLERILLNSPAGKDAFVQLLLH